jgi:hypothetical protein
MYAPEDQAVREYEVTYTNGEVVVVSARTPEMALALAEKFAEVHGYVGLTAVSAQLLSLQPVGT